MGEVETFCEYCGSHLRFLPDENEMQVVRTREEMKYRERVAVQKEILSRKLKQEELDKWRETAGKVAIAALPLIGDAAGKAVFRATLQRSRGCLGCGCVVLLVIVGGLIVAALGYL